MLDALSSGDGPSSCAGQYLCQVPDSKALQLCCCGPALPDQQSHVRLERKGARAPHTDMERFYLSATVVAVMGYESEGLGGDWPAMSATDGNG
jgi:hypothetical protein